jgi:hypothetical protein
VIDEVNWLTKRPVTPHRTPASAISKSLLMTLINFAREHVDLMGRKLQAIARGGGGGGGHFKELYN